MSHEPVVGWPSLAITEHRVPRAQMEERCARHVGFGMTPLACAEFDLRASQCHIWLTHDAANLIIEHERLHCAGYDHIGSTNMRDALARWRQQ